MSGESEEFREIFIGEAEELFGRIESALVGLEKSPGEARLVQEVFRSLHTLKGNAASMEFQKISELARGAEDYLKPMTNEGAAFAPAAMQLLLAVRDLLRRLLQEVRDKKDFGIQIEPVLEQLKRPPPAGNGGQADGQ